MKYRMTDRETSAVKRTLKKSINCTLERFRKEKKFPIEQIILNVQGDGEEKSIKLSILTFEIMKAAEVELLAVFDSFSFKIKSIKKMRKIASILNGKQGTPSTYFMTTKEAAVLLNVNQMTIWREINKKQLKAQKFGRCWRISLGDLMQYLEFRSNRKAGVT